MLAAPAIQQLAGKYRVLAQLGQGGTADVSLAALRGPSGFNKLVVLKSMKDSLKAEPEFARMFLTEARLAARLNHPNIVQTNEVFEFQGLPVIVMEYLEGQPLSSVLARSTARPFPLAMHLRVLSDMLSGLHYAHELLDYDGTPLGVVHRDVTPQNVFLTFDGQVKLLDFGIAKLSSSHPDTATGVIKGKLRYMPPEQVAAEGVDRRADIYSVGVMLWEAVTGQRMWHGLSDATVINRTLGGQMVPAHDLNPQVAPELMSIIDRALAPEPEDRYSSAADMRAALDGYLATLQAVHVREIGHCVAELFTDMRQATRDVIETQLSRVANLSEAEYDKLAPLELTEFASVSGAVAGARREPQRKRASTSRTLFLLAAAFGAVLILVTALFSWQLLARPEKDPAPPPQAVAIQSDKRVSVRVTAFPATAKLYLDGELLPSNPVSQSFRLDAARRMSLVAEAEGYASEKRSFKLDQDREIVLTLTAKELPQGGSGRPAPAPAKADKAAPHQASSDLDTQCNPPYFFDERGVKKYKSRCL